MKPATVPPDNSTSFAAASAVPPVAIKSSIIRIFSFFDIESLCTSIVASPYSSLKSTEYLSAGNLFFFLSKINGFLVDANNHKKIIKIIDFCLNNKSANVITQKARLKIKKNFNLKKNIKFFLKHVSQ